MGLISWFSSGSTDKCSCTCARCNPPVVEAITQTRKGLQVNKVLPNPDPNNWRIVRHCEEGRYLLVELEYPDCTNYEGKKIMLYTEITFNELKKQKTLDPHFAQNPDYFSPIARFEPTHRGWETARFLMRTLNIHHTTIPTYLF